MRYLITAVFGIMIYFLFWITTVATSVHLPEVETPPILYSNETSNDLKLTFNQAMEEAQESILVIIYSLVDKKLIQTLREKAENGISVIVICDPEASKGVEKKLGSKVKTYKRRGQGIMHMKILITDNTRVWIGSANMTTQSLKVHGNLVVGLYSPDLALAILEKADTMIQTGIKKPHLHRSFKVHNQTVELWFLPDDDHAIHRIEGLIQTAKKTIRVAMFTWTRDDLAKELIRAHKKGISVEVALDRSTSSGVSSKIAKMLADEGIPVLMNSGTGLLHHKMMVIDDETLVIGSANWTLAAFEKNNDCFLVITPLESEQINALQKLWKNIERNKSR